MKCQCCNERDAQQRFHINIMGQTAETLMCDHCVKRLRQYATGLMDALTQNGFAGFDPPAVSALPESESPFPKDAGRRFKLRRRLNELRQQLKDAVAAEDYETAAALRDAIIQEERNAYTYDS